MGIHITILAAFYLLSGLSELLLAFAVLVLGTGAELLAGDASTFALTVGLLTTIAIFFVVIGLPGLILAYGLLRRRSWSRPLGFALGALNLVNFPFGTILGVYTMFVLTRAEVIAELEGR